MSIFRRPDEPIVAKQQDEGESTATVFAEAPVVAQETSADALRAEAQRARADADAEVVRLKANAEQAAAELERQAEEVEAEQAQQARAGAYLAAVEAGRADFARALSQEADLAALVEHNAVYRDEVATRHAAAIARAGDAQRAWDAAKLRGADLDELAELRIALAASTSLPDAVAEQLADADEGHRRALDAHSRATDAVKISWRHLEILAATDGVECPQGLGLTAAEKRAAREAEQRHDAAILAAAARSPEYQAGKAQRRARRDAARRVLHPAYDPITRAANAANEFLGNQHRG